MKIPSIPTFILSSLLSIPISVLANTEKTIFLGPETVRVPSQHPTLSDLHLDVLTPQDNNWSLRTSLPRQFPNATNPHGPAAWFLLDELTQDRRYEVRVCWAATVSFYYLSIYLFRPLSHLLALTHAPIHRCNHLPPYSAPSHSPTHQSKSHLISLKLTSS